MCLAMKSTATFSPCKQYRYTLTRTWDEELPRIVFIMLNPSKATAEISDPTVSRCLERAKRLGFGSLTVLNIFAYRSTNPQDLYKLDDPVGPENDWAITAAIKAGSTVICGWGNHGRLHGRGAIVLDLLWSIGHKPRALKMTSLGEPWHPLYLGYSLNHIEMERP